ncbi:MAG: hypothetical protein NTV54_15015 [Ignavibacteriales bacterium]|nr:hypothetical protein [Ignavibacteriales bacterium]
MSEQEYNYLWRYSEKFSRDNLQRSELITMAWKEGERLGKRNTPGLMKSMMHYRSKELNKRSAFPAAEVGKSQKDAWNHERVYVDRPVSGGTTSLAEFLLLMRVTPLDFAMANDFMESLTEEERTFLDDLTAGYTMKEISQRHHIKYSRFPILRTALQEKAVAYL